MKIKFKVYPFELEMGAEAIVHPLRRVVARYRLRTRYGSASEMPVALLLFFCVSLSSGIFLFSSTFVCALPTYYTTLMSGAWDSKAPLATGMLVAVAIAACCSWISTYYFARALVTKLARG